MLTNRFSLTIYGLVRGHNQSSPFLFGFQHTQSQRTGLWKDLIAGTTETDKVYVLKPVYVLTSKVLHVDTLLVAYRDVSSQVQATSCPSSARSFPTSQATGRHHTFRRWRQLRPRKVALGLLQ